MQKIAVGENTNSGKKVTVAVNINCGKKSIFVKLEFVLILYHKFEIVFLITGNRFK